MPNRDPPAPSQYTIAELARLGGSTVRNIRAYQERGILPAPVRQGRLGIYNDDHLLRLRVINNLLARGYSIANIGELIQAAETGQALSHLLGIDMALTRHWVADLPSADVPLSDLINSLPVAPSAQDVQRTFELGIIEARGGGLVRVARPDLLQLALPFLQNGVSLSHLLDIMTSVRVHINHVAQTLSRVALDAIFQPPLANQDIEQIKQLIWSIRPLTSNALQQEVLLALSQQLSQQMTDQVIHQLLNRPTNAT